MQLAVAQLQLREVSGQITSLRSASDGRDSKGWPRRVGDSRKGEGPFLNVLCRGSTQSPLLPWPFIRDDGKKATSDLLMTPRRKRVWLSAWGMHGISSRGSAAWLWALSPEVDGTACESWLFQLTAVWLWNIHFNLSEPSFLICKRRINDGTN